jgi:very-short-patch-repair endonuclease
MLRYNKDLKQFSQRLRREMMDAEKLLWSKIKGKQLKGAQFYRQETLGNFIVDFYCPIASLVIELDGGQHYNNEMKVKDSQRDRTLKDMGLSVLRFSDREVFDNTGAILKKIWNYL